MPANRFNGFTDYGIGIGLRIPHYQHILHREAGGRLVRDHLGKLHGRWRPSARDSRPDSRAIPRRAAWRLDVFRLGRAAESRASEAAQGAGEAHQDALAHRSSLLGQRGRPLHARPAADALHVGGRRSHRAKDPRGAGFPGSARSPSRTSAATPSFTSPR